MISNFKTTNSAAYNIGLARYCQGDAQKAPIKTGKE